MVLTFLHQLTLDYMKLSREEALDADIPLLFISFPSTKDPEWKKRYPGRKMMYKFNSFNAHYSVELPYKITLKKTIILKPEKKALAEMNLRAFCSDAELCQLVKFNFYTFTTRKDDHGYCDPDALRVGC